jgi:hypothetical protein
MTILLAFWGALLSTVLIVMKVSDYVRNRALIELDVNDPLVKRDSRALSLTLRIENTGNKPTAISNHLLTIFERDNQWTAIPPENKMLHDLPHVTAPTSPTWDVEYVQPGQLLEKKLHFTLPRRCEDETICCHVTTQLDRNRTTSTSLLALNLNKEMVRKLSPPPIPRAML